MPRNTHNLGFEGSGITVGDYVLGLRIFYTHSRCGVQRFGIDGVTNGLSV